MKHILTLALACTLAACATEVPAYRWHRTGETLPDSVVEELRGHDVILLGAIGDPSVHVRIKATSLWQINRQVAETYRRGRAFLVDRATGEVSYGRIPSGSVVVSGNLPSADGKYSLYCAVIVKRVDAQTRSKTSINDLLRGA